MAAFLFAKRNVATLVSLMTDRIEMNDNDQINYQRIAVAIDYIKSHFKEQPSLDDIASVVGLSPFHFQRLFSDWAGVSPKKFIQYLSLDYAKKLLKNNHATLLDATHETGLSGTSRLHDLFVNIESMTPGEYKNDGKNLSINYSFSNSPFGKIIVASTHKGICYMSFEEDEDRALFNLTSRFSHAKYHQVVDKFQQNSLLIFQKDWGQIDQIRLHIKGTDFQLKVWEALLKLPFGSLGSYGLIANSMNRPKASRAVGTAIGNNPVAFLIPCHRVIQKNGNIGGYMWGDTRKSAIIGWEASQII